MSKAADVFEKLAINLTPGLAEKLMANRAIRTMVSDSTRMFGGGDWFEVGQRTSKQLRSLASKLKDKAPEPLKKFVKEDYYVPDKGLESSVNLTLQNAFWDSIKGPHTGQTVDAIQMLGKKYNPKQGTKARQALDTFMKDLNKRQPHLVLDKNPDRAARVFDNNIPDYFKKAEYMLEKLSGINPIKVEKAIADRVIKLQGLPWMEQKTTQLMEKTRKQILNLDKNKKLPSKVEFESFDRKMLKNPISRSNYTGAYITFNNILKDIKKF